MCTIKVMVALLATALFVLVVLLASEVVWRRHDIDPEYARKLVHISVGSFVAFWPLFLTREEILGLSVVFMVAVLASKYLNIFKAIHSVQRPTWGEFLFAASVGILALAAQSGWIYLAALLHMSLADGLAAVVGTKYGRSTHYKVFGHTKSVAGTATFTVISALIFVGYFILTLNTFTLWFIPITFASAVIENAAVRGLDNLFVPLLVAVCLNLL